ncbi:MAG: hypothetical protein GY801_14490 [bacterium]|nr:hypothetical protein [bacterium]
MDLHVMGGFLGSGKTTAIIGAAKQLLQQGKRVGVVTNDQGKYLVDTAFVSLNDVPTVEVSGGCFCCNYDDLEARLDTLRTMAAPDVIFAESVGSCVDVVATVMKPLTEFRRIPCEHTSLSVFVDSRLLLRRLRGLPLVFSDGVCYIFDKQLEEAGIIVMNKQDLLTAEERLEIERLAQEHFPEKTIRLQNSLKSQSITDWMTLLEAKPQSFPDRAIEIDYERYGAGEARLAWLDEEITLSVPPDSGREKLILLIRALIKAIRQYPVGHVKFFVRGRHIEHKISFVTLDDPAWEKQVPQIPDTTFSVLMNARVETEASILRNLVDHTLKETAVQEQLSYEEDRISAFHPGMPHPIHRMN